MFMPMLFQIGSSCVLLTLTGYQVMISTEKSGDLVHSLHIIFIFAELLFYCRRGEQLKTEVS